MKTTRDLTLQKSQAPKSKSLAQTELTPIVLNTSVCKQLTNNGLHEPSRARAGSNKSQHAAQAPALRVTQIQDSKHMIHQHPSAIV
jgi:hypothetical protein